MKRVLLGLGVLSLLCLTAGQASAHTISLGVYNAGGPGNVTLAMGTYSHGTPVFQGTMTLTAGPGIPPTQAQNFSSVTTVKPVGLIDGVNNFYINTSTPAIADAFNLPVNPLLPGTPVANWQELTFTGLAPGVYTYQLSGMTLVNWSNWNTSQSNWSGTFTVSGQTAGIVPEPISLVVFGSLVVGGIVAVRRRMGKVAA